VSPLPDPNQLLIGALAFLRITGILFALPLIGDSPTPVRARILAALALTIGLQSVIPVSWAPALTVDVLQIAVYVVRELLIGLVTGFFARVTFDGLVMASSIVAYQMGFGTANMFLPDYSERLDSFTAFHRMIVMLIFLSLGLHHIFIAGIVDSFKLVPGGTAVMQGSLATLMIQITGGMIAVAIQLAAPILVALMFTMAALGLIARTVPNMNVFIISFPASFVIGLVVYIATLPFFPEWMREHFLSSHEQMFAALRTMVR
jgi:flagellar biosynthetic protein FliR